VIRAATGPDDRSLPTAGWGRQCRARSSGRRAVRFSHLGHRKRESLSGWRRFKN